MIKVLKIILVVFIGCIGLGFFVSVIEKINEKKGWIDGHKPYGVYEKYIKRSLDFGLAMFALMLFWPVLIFIALVVKINMGSPVIFVQERPGLGGEIFKLKKFRTMSDKRDKNGELLPDEQRLTSFGLWLRQISGDEIGEIWNIIRGDLAIVGPRPLLIEYLPYYTEEENHRHDVRPGLTGLAQVSGRNTLKWKERFALDVEYVNHITFLGDLKIILLTIKKVISHKDVVVPGAESIESNFAHERKNELDERTKGS